MKSKPKVGQTLYSLNIGNACRNCEQKLTPVKVVKVGSKYFECLEDGYHRPTVYHLDGWYEKPQDWEDKKNPQRFVGLLKNHLDIVTN